MSVRINGSGDYLRRTANLPSSTSFTFCGWSRRITSQDGIFRFFCGIEDATTSASNALVFGWDSANTFHAYSQNGSAVFGSGPSVGADFFWAFACSGTGVSSYQAYWRSVNDTALTGALGTGASFTPAMVIVGNDSYDEWIDMRVWNVKCWDRVLTAAEILVESFYDAVKFPSSINFHWKLPDTSRVEDSSGNGRGATVGGSLASELTSWQPWKPGARIYIGPAAARPPLFGSLGDFDPLMRAEAWF